MLTATSKYYQLLLITTILIAQSCSKNALFKTGAIKKQERQLADFSEIDLHDKVNLVLTHDSTVGIWVEAGENIIDDIETKVSDGKLEIRDNTRFRWTRNLDYTITVYVNTNILKRITFYGAGKITSTNTLMADEFYLDSFNGVGSADLSLECRYAELIIRVANADFTLRGKAETTIMYCADYGSMNLNAFKSQDLNLDYRSIRDSKINVSRLLSGKIHYRGNVYFTGNPSSTVELENSGKLIHVP